MTRMAGSTYDLNKLGSILFEDRDTRDPWINHLDQFWNTKPGFRKPGNVIEIDGSDVYLPQDAAPARWFGPDVDPTELPLMKDRYLRQPTVLAQNPNPGRFMDVGSQSQEEVKRLYEEGMLTSPTGQGIRERMKLMRPGLNLRGV